MFLSYSKIYSVDIDDIFYGDADDGSLAVILLALLFKYIYLRIYIIDYYVF